MRISITSSCGIGPTELSAFDAALCNAGIANFNLLRLSSVIPPLAEINLTDKVTGHEGEWGDRLYVVMAEARTSIPNDQAWAGVGWVQDQSTGKGLFVEHEGHSEDTVRDDICNSLQALMKNRRSDFGETHMLVTGITCHVKPVCAMVVAVYQSQPWLVETKR